MGKGEGMGPGNRGGSRDRGGWVGGGGGGGGGGSAQITSNKEAHVTLSSDPIIHHKVKQT